MKLTQEILKELLSYNPLTGDLIWNVRDKKWFSTIKSGKGNPSKSWNTRYSGVVAGNLLPCSSGKNYWTVSIFKKRYLAHRLIWMYTKGSFPDGEIDHIDGNGLNNSICNLRIVSSHQNNMNMRKPSNNTSGIIGVHFCKQTNLWRASIGFKCKTYQLGRYENINDAIKARKNAEKRLGFHENHGTNRPL